MNRKRLKSQIKKHEGFVPVVYKDSVGVPTIGYGRNIQDKGLSMSESDILLDNDLNETEDTLRSAFEWFNKLDEPRQEVVANMCFNLGLTRLKTFKRMIQAIQYENYEMAADEMLDSKWATQVGKRALELSEIMRKGAYGH